MRAGRSATVNRERGMMRQRERVEARAVFFWAGGRM